MTARLATARCRRPGHDGSVRKRLGVAVIALALVLAAGATAQAQTSGVDTTDIGGSAATASSATTAQSNPLAGIGGKAWILVDADTGVILAAKNEHTPRLIASTVKIVTALTALRKLGPEATLTISDTASRQPAFRIGAKPGERWPMKDALYSLFLVSANDIAYALAENAGGSAKAFAADMTETGRLLGFKDSTFADPAGFDGGEAPNGPSKMSAYDLAIAGRAALKDPTLAPIVGTPRYEFVGPDGRQHKLVVHSKQLRPERPEYYKGTNGVKTGWTKAASGTYVSSATRNGRTLIAVVLGIQQIYPPAQALLNYGFALSRSNQGIGVSLPAAQVLAAGTTTTSTTALAGSSASTASTAGVETDAERTSSGGNGLPTAVKVAVALLVVLVAFVAWRRAVVRARRRRRQAARAKAIAVTRVAGWADDAEVGDGRQ